MKYLKLILILMVGIFSHVYGASAALGAIKEEFNKDSINTPKKAHALVQEKIDPWLNNPAAEAAEKMAFGVFLADLGHDIGETCGYNNTTRILFTRAAELGDPYGQMDLAADLNHRQFPLGTVHWVFESLRTGVTRDTSISKEKDKSLPVLMGTLRAFVTTEFMDVVKEYVGFLQSSLGNAGTDGAEGKSNGASGSGAVSSKAAAGAGAGGSAGATSFEDDLQAYKHKLAMSFLTHEGHKARGFSYNPSMEAVRWGPDGVTYDFNDPVFACCTDLYLAVEPDVFNSAKYALTAANLDNLVDSRAFRRLYEINLTRAGITDAQVVRLVGNNAFAGVTRITLNHNRLTDVSTKALAESRVLGSRSYGIGLPMSGRYGKPAVEMRYSLDENKMSLEGIKHFLTPEPLPLRVEIYHPADDSRPTETVDAIRIITDLEIGYQELDPDPALNLAARHKMASGLTALLDTGNIRSYVRNVTMDK